MNRIVRKLAALTMLMVLGACSSAPKPLALEDAKYVNTAVPAFANATYEDRAGGTYYDDGGGESAKSMSWFFKTDAPMSECVAFYEHALPQAEKEVYDDSVVLSWKPEGGREGDEITITLSEGEIQITETVDTRTQ